jgi:hypothetical protein
MIAILVYHQLIEYEKQQAPIRGLFIPYETMIKDIKKRHTLVRVHPSFIYYPNIILLMAMPAARPKAIIANTMPSNVFVQFFSSRVKIKIKTPTNIKMNDQFHQNIG